MKHHDPQNLKKDLLTVAVWRVSQNAAWLGVTPIFYRRHIMSLPNHPTPIDSTAARLSYWGAEMREFLSDFSNLKRG